MSYKIEYDQGDENLYVDKKLAAYRRQRPPKTTGNPYYVLGEPVGDLRDNMGCENVDLCPEIEGKEERVQGVPIRWYAGSSRKDRPCIFYIHGGAFIGGDLDAAEHACKYMARNSGALVVSIDYGLAPETAYPHNGEDCVKVIEALIKSENKGENKNETLFFDPGRVYLSGDSAGANMACYCAQRMDFEFAGMMLYYPVVDLSGASEYWTWKADGYRGYEDSLVSHFITSLKGSEGLMQKLYLQGYEDVKNPLVSPLYMKDPSILPPVLIQYAEYDYLAVQIEAFIKKLEEDGHRIYSYCYQGVNHAFLDLLGIIDQAQISLDIVCKFVKGELE